MDVIDYDTRDLLANAQISRHDELVFSVSGGRHTLEGVGQDVIEAIRTTVGSSFTVNQRDVTPDRGELKVYVGSDNPRGLLAAINMKLNLSR